MISHAKISHHRRMFKTFTGLSTEGFKQMLPSFEEAWEADLDRRDAGRLCLRGRGGGRKGGPGVRRQTRVHPGLFPALPHPSGAGSALRDEPAAGQRVGSPSDPVPQYGTRPPAATPSPPALRPRGVAVHLALCIPAFQMRDELAFQKLARALPEQFQTLGFPRRGVSLRVCTFLRGRLLWSSSVYFDELASKHKHPRTCRLPYWLPSAKQLAPCKGYLNSTGKDCNGE